MEKRDVFAELDCLGNEIVILKRKMQILEDIAGAEIWPCSECHTLSAELPYATDGPFWLCEQCYNRHKEHFGKWAVTGV